MQNNRGGNSPLTQPAPPLGSILRAFFKLLYHQFAFTYDWVASIVSLGAWQSWVESVSPYLDGPKTLEIGFGPGHLQACLYQKGISVYGIDESSQMARITLRRMNKLGRASHLVQGNAQNLPYANESFNQVVMTFPAEFLINPQTFIDIHRVLIKEGVAIIVPYAWITGNKPWERAIAWINRITGEAPDWDQRFLEPLNNLGFQVSWKIISFTFSKIILIQLDKT